MIGSRIGPYEVISKLGEGGMGEVYRARDSKLKRDVAIKVSPEAFARPLRFRGKPTRLSVAIELEAPAVTTFRKVIGAPSAAASYSARIGLAWWARGGVSRPQHLQKLAQNRSRIRGLWIAIGP